MCLLVLAHTTDPRLPLLLAGNRDERHGRETAPLDWWPEEDWVAGKDLIAGGTWLAVARDGRFAVVTNYPKLAGPPRARSRGLLVADFLSQRREPLTFVTALSADRGNYAGFSLLVGDRSHVAYYNNAEDAPRRLGPGIYALGNDGLDAPSPRVKRARTRVSALLAEGRADTASLFGFWAERPTDEADPAPFIAGHHYGTRSTTILRRTPEAISIAEVCYDADGTPLPARSFTWPSGH